MHIMINLAQRPVSQHSSTVKVLFGTKNLAQEPHPPKSVSHRNRRFICKLTVNWLHIFLAKRAYDVALLVAVEPSIKFRYSSMIRQLVCAIMWEGQLTHKVSNNASLKYQYSKRRIKKCILSKVSQTSKHDGSI